MHHAPQINEDEPVGARDQQDNSNPLDRLPPVALLPYAVEFVHAPKHYTKENHMLLAAEGIGLMTVLIVLAIIALIIFIIRGR